MILEQLSIIFIDDKILTYVCISTVQLLTKYRFQLDTNIYYTRTKRIVSTVHRLDNNFPPETTLDGYMIGARFLINILFTEQKNVMLSSNLLKFRNKNTVIINVGPLALLLIRWTRRTNSELPLRRALRNDLTEIVHDGGKAIKSFRIIIKWICMSQLTSWSY